MIYILIFSCVSTTRQFVSVATSLPRFVASAGARLDFQRNVPERYPLCDVNYLPRSVKLLLRTFTGSELFASLVIAIDKEELWGPNRCAMYQIMWACDCHFRNSTSSQSRVNP